MSAGMQTPYSGSFRREITSPSAYFRYHMKGVHLDLTASSSTLMNTRQVIDDSAGPVSLSAAFNNDSSCFSVGLDTGFCGKTHCRPTFIHLTNGNLIDGQFSTRTHVS